MNRLADLISKTPLFQKLNIEELQVVARHMTIFELDSGDILFREGDPGDCVCFILDGHLEVLKSGSKGDALLAVLGPGQSIGEMAVIDAFPRSATVRARSKATLALLSRSAFDLLLEKPSRIGVKLLKGLARLLSENLRSTSNRLAEYLPPLG